MPTIDRAAILQEQENHDRKVAEMKEKQVMVFEGDLVEVELTDNLVQTLNEQGADGKTYTFYIYQVLHGGKEKVLKLFLNQAADMERCSKKKGSNNISIRRPKGSKKLEFS